MLIQDYERQVESAGTPDALWDVCSEYFRPTVVDRLFYLHIPPLGAPDSRRVSGYGEGFPEELMARYIEDQLYRDNPMLRHAQQHVEPIYWDELEQVEPMTERERAFIAELRYANIGDGVGIHVYGPNGRCGLCSLGFRPGIRRLDQPVLFEFQWVCQLAHLRYCSILVATLGPVPELSERETEVLAWVARGKSNGLIGDILGISSHTVDAHLRRIYLKLGVFDRISAAVRGMGFGLIHGGS